MLNQNNQNSTMATGTVSVVKRVLAFGCLLLMLGVQWSFAQSFQVRGKVTVADGAPLPGATILEAGKPTNGAQSDIDGNYSFSLSSRNASITVSFVGYVTQTIAVNGRSTVNIVLAEDTSLGSEVVVTALGIEKQQKSVGYSVTEIRGEDLVAVRENNIVNALAGKVAGVNVSKPASGVNGSSRIIIRGNNTFGNNQPLYVVDGVPIDNSNQGQAGEWGGRDGGDGVSSLNPDDIETFTILKSDAATALYGSRALNGVVLVTTKKGVKRNGIGVEFNSNLTTESIAVLADWQYEYGQGKLGTKPTTATDALATGLLSWGAKLDGSSVIQFDGVSRPYSAVKTNMQDFYQPGLTANNTIAFSGGTDKSTFRFSATNLNAKGLLVNDDLNRTSFNLRGSTQLGSRLEVDAKVNYVTEGTNNRSNQSDSPGNPNASIYRLPTNVSILSFNPRGEVEGNPLAEQEFNDNPFVTNPYWAVYHYKNSDNRERVIGYVSATYKFTDWLSLMGRTGQDWYNLRVTSLEPQGTAFKKQGGMSESSQNVKERNSDFLLSAKRNMSDISVSAYAGGNQLDRTYEGLFTGGDTFNIPGLVSINNLKNQNRSIGYSRKKVNSLYGGLDLGYKNYLFLSFTGRNDWFSTLTSATSNENSQFYPSASLSWVVSDMTKLPELVNFLKVRGSWAQTGSDSQIEPYALGLTYGLVAQGHNGSPLGALNNGAVPPAGLKPTLGTGMELGLTTRILDNKVGLDVTFYNKSITNQILSATISGTTGYGSRVINSGEITNKGVEALLSLTPVNNSKLRWELDVNFAKNTNKVVSLQGQQTSLFLGQSRTLNAFTYAEVGEPMGVIKGYKFVRNADGSIQHGADGFPVRESALSVLGNPNPDWTSGISNTFLFGNFSLNALIDISMGGEMYSATNAYAYYFGLHMDTLEGRDQGNNFKAPGSNVAMNAQTYYQKFYNNYTEQFVYDASYVKLRSFALGYRIPVSMLAKTPIRGAELQLVGRNLLLLYSKVPNIDPESSYSVGGSYGLEMYGVPQTRSLGFNVSLRF